MSTLDLAQHLYVCRECGERATVLSCPAHPRAGVQIEPTLLFADFVTCMDALRVQHGPDVPSDADVWDRLESCTDTAPTNREAIDNAIRWVVSQ